MLTSPFFFGEMEPIDEMDGLVGKKFIRILETWIFYVAKLQPRVYRVQLEHPRPTRLRHLLPFPCGDATEVTSHAQFRLSNRGRCRFRIGFVIFIVIATLATALGVASNGSIEKRNRRQIGCVSS